MLRFAATDEPFQAWFAPPGIEGRFNYNADFSGFNFERKLATVDQLLDLLLRQIGQREALLDVCGRDSDPEAPARASSRIFR